jgi:hypothetical protein
MIDMQATEISMKAMPRTTSSPPAPIGAGRNARGIELTPMPERQR